MTADDEIRIIKDAVRLLGDDVAGRLWTRGWAVAELEVDSDAPLQWYWPPTAPAGYGSAAESRGEDPAETPWTVPTRITREGDGWKVEYGAAAAQTPGRPELFPDGRALLDELSRIECWPMAAGEAHRLRAGRIVEVTMAVARDDHYRACSMTEPYASRLEAINGHRMAEHPRGRRRGINPPSTPRQQGDLTAQMILTEADAWVAAMRTARAGGRGWSVNGRETNGG